MTRRWILVAVGCGGDPDTGPVSASDVEEACTQFCERETVCEGPDDECVGRCVADQSPWMRTDAVQTLYACIAALDCDAREEAECGGTVAPLAVHRAYEANCRAAMPTCVEARFLETLCEVDYVADAPGEAGFVRLLAPVVVEALDACFDGATCDDRLRGLTGAFDHYGLD
ncbi:MAG: hypothetical protein WKG01_34055 [Kofleriaceae bacterium]